MKRFLRCALGLWLILAATSGYAQYPAKPIRLIVALAAGGPSDSAARLVASDLAKALGQQIIVENRPGADGALAAGAVLGSPSDGHTLFWSSTTALIAVPLLNQNPPYDPLAFTPVSMVGRFGLFLFSNPELPAKSLAEVVDYARTRPEALNYATSSFGDVVAASQLIKATGIKMTRVAYKGAAQAIPDLVAGRVQLAIAPASAGLPHVKEGRLRALAVFLPQRNPVAPEVPTVAEAGIAGLTSLSTPWVAIFGPAGMPKEITERLSRDINLVLRQQVLKAQLERHSFQVEGSTPEALASFFREDFERSKLVVRELGIAR
jgi:tripartite-type tricarboxylate transporter receptor subunit TctC